MSKSKQKGTFFETEIVRCLSQHWPTVERRTLSGAQDKGDIAGIVGVVIEAKNCVKQDLAGWITEAEVERHNAKADVGVVWHKRKGKASALDGYVTMTGEMFIHLLRGRPLLP